MQHHRDLNELRLPSSVLTIGSFDGVHLGHQDLVRQLVDSAGRHGWPGVVLTFYPHPSVVLRKRTPPFYINTPEEKAELLGKLGVEHVITHPFDLQLSKIEADDFLAWLHDQLGFRQLWAGPDFAMGHERRGNRQFLEEQSAQHGFELCIAEPLKIDGEVISATRVREALRSGDVARAASYLGRPFMLTGTAVRGAGGGAPLGIPTANLSIWEERACPGSGVYACRAVVAGEQWAAVTNIGIRPKSQDEPERPVVETHLLDFKGELYQQEVRLSFIERLRDERKFDRPPALNKSIARDIRRARKLLLSAGELG